MTPYSQLRLAAVLITLAAAPAALADSDHRPAGASRVVAQVPAPGLPEGIAIKGHKFYVAGPAAFGLTDTAVIFEYSLQSGTLLRQLPITIANPYIPFRAASCIAFGEDENLYVIEPFVGIIKMKLDAANTQSVYATFPQIQPTLLNDLAFDEKGNLYVTDTFQGAIYKVAPGGGPAQLWFADPRLAGNPNLPFGVNGIRVDKQGKRLYVSVTVRNDFSGAILSLPLVAQPTAAQLTEFHVYPASQMGFPGPDGIAFAKNGKLYVALAGTSEISVLLPNGQEHRRYTAPANVPWVNPANIAFDDENDRILVTNHASLVNPLNPAFFTVFDVAVPDKGLQLP
jgi:sugar lactone lactonase YvrE